MQQPTVFRADTPSVCEVARVDEHIAMRVHHSLRLSGRTRSVKQHRQAVRFRQSRQIVIGKIDIRIRKIDNIDRAATDLWYQSAVVWVSDDEFGAAISQYVIQAISRIGGIQGD